MATVNIFKVHYHFESGGKKSSMEYIDYVSCSLGDYNSIKTVLSNNSLLRAGTLVIDSVQNIGVGAYS